MNGITFGRYIPGKGIIYDLDPRIKIVCMILLLVGVFLPAGWIGYAVMGFVVIVLLLLSGLGIRYLFRTVKPMFFMVLFLFVINLLVVKTGNKLIAIGSFEIYDGAIFQTLYIFIRLILMLSISGILTTTTKPLDLTLGIEDLLAPLAKIKVPAHEIAMMISIALRFIPTLLDEIQRIMKAQESRGVDLQEGKLKEKIMAVLSLIVPLFVSSFQRADELANAMEARGYVPDAHRTRYKQLHIHTKDIVCLILCILLVAGLIVLSVVK